MKDSHKLRNTVACLAFATAAAGGAFYAEHRWSIVNKVTGYMGSAKGAVVETLVTDPQEAFSDFMKTAHKYQKKGSLSQYDIGAMVREVRSLQSPSDNTKELLEEFKNGYQDNISRLMEMVDTAQARYALDSISAVLPPGEKAGYVTETAEALSLEQQLGVAGSIAMGLPMRDREDFIVGQYKSAVEDGANAGRMMYDMVGFSMDKGVQNLKERFEHGTDK